MEQDRLTTKSQEAVSTAVRRASTEGHPEVAPVHLLLALLDQPEGIAGSLLAAVGADAATVEPLAAGRACISVSARVRTPDGSVPTADNSVAAMPSG